MDRVMMDQMLLNEYAQLPAPSTSPWPNMQRAPGGVFDNVDILSDEQKQAEMERIDNEIIQEKKRMMMMEAASKAFWLGRNKGKGKSSPTPTAKSSDIPKSKSPWYLMDQLDAARNQPMPVMTTAPVRPAVVPTAARVPYTPLPKSMYWQFESTPPVQESPYVLPTALVPYTR